MTNRLTTRPIDKLLAKLDCIKPRKINKATKGQAQWRARCPAHADKSPSLIITECTNGTILIKCWAGCTAHDIVSAVGLELKDLFVYEPSHSHHANNQGTYKTNHRKQYLAKKYPSQQAITHEQLIISIAEVTLSKGQALAPADNQRYQQAKQRLSLLNQEVSS